MKLTTRKSVSRRKQGKKSARPRPSRDGKGSKSRSGSSKSSVNKGAPAQKRRAATILARLEKLYPEARCSLVHASPLQLLIATILSAQCTDARVNMVVPALFARFSTAKDFAEAEPTELEGLIRSTGFYHNKARNIIACAQQLLLRHGGQVPASMEELVQLPGIGRKTANVVLGNAFDTPALVVDTHVTRLANLLSLTVQKDPNKIELDLMAVIPRAKWTELAHLFIEHGRRVCVARRPRCGECVLNDLCPSSEV